MAWTPSVPITVRWQASIIDQVIRLPPPASGHSPKAPALVNSRSAQRYQPNTSMPEGATPSYMMPQERPAMPGASRALATTRYTSEFTPTGQVLT